MFPTIDLNNGKTRNALNASAALAWLVLLPIGKVMWLDSLAAACGWIVGTSVVLPLMGTYLTRPRKQLVITVATEAEKVAAEKKLRRKYVIVNWAFWALLAVVVALSISIGGWGVALMLLGISGEARLQKQVNAFKGKKLAAFMAVSAIVMIVVAVSVTFVA